MKTIRTIKTYAIPARRVRKIIFNRHSIYLANVKLRGSPASGRVPLDCRVSRDNNQNAQPDSALYITTKKTLTELYYYVTGLHHATHYKKDANSLSYTIDAEA